MRQDFQPGGTLCAYYGEPPSIPTFFSAIEFPTLGAPYPRLHSDLTMSSSDNISIALLSDDDIPTCAELLSKSFGHDAPFVDIYFPDHDTPLGQASLSKRLTLWKRSSPESTFLKSVTRSSEGGDEVIAGFGIWTLMKEPPPAELEKAEN